MRKKLLSFFACCFLAGCASVPSQEVVSSVPATPPPQEQFQFTGPWEPLLFESFYTNLYPVSADLPPLKGGFVPHHLVAGAIDATFFHALEKQNPSVVVIIGPNHFGRGQGALITTARNWQTPFGEVKTDTSILGVLKQNNLVSIEEEVMKEEHSTYTIIPFVKKSLPKAAVVPLIIKENAPTSTLDALVNTLVRYLPADAVIVGSIDFSHYKPLATANENDEKTIDVIKNFEYDQLPPLDVDSPKSIYVILKLMERFEAKHIVHSFHSNSAIITHDLTAKETTSYYSPYFSQY